MKIDDSVKSIAQLLSSPKGWHIVCSQKDSAFDNIVSAAAQICSAPFSFISLDTPHQNKIKSSKGLDIEEAYSLNKEIQVYVQSKHIPTEISDLLQNIRLVETLPSLAQKRIRFFLATPLIGPDGKKVGILCALSPEAQSLSQEQILSLKLLADQAVQLLILRLKEASLSLVATELEALRALYSIVEYDPSGKILWANENFLEIFGYKLDELINKHHRILLPFNQTRSSDYQHFWSEITKGYTIRNIFKRVTKGETEVWLDSSYNPIYDNDGKLLKIIEISIDKTIEKNLASEAQQRISSMSTSSAVIEFDINGYILAVNNNFLKIVEYAPHELVGKHHSVLVSPSVRDTPQYRDFWKNLSQGINQTGVFERITKRGKKIFIRGTYNTIFDINGMPYKIIKYAHDFTDEHVNNLGNNEVKLSVDRSTSFVELDLKGNIVSANENFLKLMKYAKSEIIGKSQSIFIPDEVLKSEDYKNFWKKLSAGQYQSGDYLWINKFGKEVWVRSSYNPIFDTSGKPYKILQFAFDITGNKLAEQNAKKAEEQIRVANLALQHQKQALDSSAIVAETDVRGRITYVNDKFLEISKYDRDELIGQDHRILNSRYHPKEFFINLWRTISKGDIWHNEVKNRAKDGTYYWVDTTIYPVKDELGKLQKYVAIRFDITDKKKAFEELQEANTKVMQASEAKSEFLANMSHEIRTPMNVIIGMSDLLKETPLNIDQEKYVNIINNSGAVLLDIINNILDLSKIESGHLDLESIPYDLDELVHTSFEIISKEAYKKGLEFTYSIDPEVKTKLQGDPARLRQVLINLLNNAIKFTRSGEVSLRIERAPNKKGFITFKVTDTGIGIPPDKLNRLFKNFSQADTSTTREYGGTGLGLSISKKLVEIMGGSIGVESVNGQGSTFYFSIPHIVNDLNPDPPPDLSPLKGKHALVVNAHPTNRKSIAEMLRSWAVPTLEAATGEETFKIVSNSYSSDQAIDIIILDCKIPDIDGLDIAKKILNDSKGKPPILIVTTTENRRSQLGRARSLGITSFMTKPFRRQELLSTIINGLRQGDKKPSILIVDKREESRERFKRVLQALNINIHCTPDCKSAISLMNKLEMHVIIANSEMKTTDGTSFHAEVRKRNNQIPFIILTKDPNNISTEMTADMQNTKYLNAAVDNETLLDMVDQLIERQFVKGTPTLSATIPLPSTEVKNINPLKILTVDDVVDNVLLIQQYLKKFPFKLDTASNGKEAIKKFSNNKYDLIFMDIQMPEMDGHEVTRRIRKIEADQNLPRTTIVALSAHTSSEERQIAQVAGTDGYLTKPIKKGSLLEAIEKYGAPASQQLKVRNSA